MEKILSLCKRRGFIFPSSEIYGGYAGFWDYGPNGVAMRRAVEALWWNYMVETRDNVEGLDSTIISHPRTWDASGHTAQFADIMIDNKINKKRYRLDTLIEQQSEYITGKIIEACEGIDDPEAMASHLAGKGEAAASLLTTAGMIDPENNKIGDWTTPRQFNLMMSTYVGPTADEDSKAYLRAETCQPIFTDFETVRIASRQKLPFGIAQVGKAFRNEISPRNFTFRSREFTQMEMEFFCKADTAMDWYNYWKGERLAFYREELNFTDKDIRIHDHEKLAHYAKAALDVEFKFPFGWGELEGVHHRGEWDMSRHAEYSGQDLRYYEQETKEKFYPTVIETSVGLDRMVLALLCKAYDEDTASTQKEGKTEDIRVVLRFPAKVAPVQVAVLPLSKKLADAAEPIYKKLRKQFRAEMDLTGAIGKRYRRQDEIGTPYCICVDFETAEDQCVTVRDRDSMEQERVQISELTSYLFGKIHG